MTNTDNGYGSRKFLITVGLIVMGFVLVLASKLDVNAFLDFAKFVGAFYLGANALQNIGTAVAG